MANGTRTGTGGRMKAKGTGMVGGIKATGNKADD